MPLRCFSCTHPKGTLPFTNYQLLSKAIATRDLSYQLLMWISDAIGVGLIPPARAAKHSGAPQAATEWLRTCYDQIPEQLRPPYGEIDEFAAFFSTFLLSSFDVVEQPGTRGELPTPTFCRCELCMRIVNAPHLQAKKLYAADKRRADFLMSECVVKLARKLGLELSEERAYEIITNRATRRHAAYYAYGHWLIQRLSGYSDGPAILALWRLIAWKPQGGMRRDFVLRIEDFKSAEVKLIGAIQHGE